MAFLYWEKLDPTFYKLDPDYWRRVVCMRDLWFVRRGSGENIYLLKVKMIKRTSMV